jgi:predicted AAA+ superfamily ATPase
MSRTLGINSITIKKYLDILEGSFLIRRLLPFYVNTTKRLVRSPKIYIRDTGLMHRLLGIRDFEQLQGSIWFGNSWETYVIEEIVRVGGKSFEYSFYRTQAGAEVDLILKGALGKLTVVEIKYSSNPVPSKGFFSAVEDLQPDFQYIIVPEGETWERNPNLKVSGLLWFLKNEIVKL